MKYTLLQLVQSILSSMDSDQVNSINDTAEALQVAECVRTSYNNMLGRYDLPEHNEFFQLTASGDNTQPTLMYRPDGVQRLEWIKYFDSNPNDGPTFQSSQFGAYRHDLNTDLQSSSWSTTSATTNTIALGLQTFTVVSSTLPTFVNQGIAASSGANTMMGTVVSYSGTTLVMNVTNTIGSGTYSSWTIISDTGAAAPPGYLEISILTPEDFFGMINQFNPSASNVGSYNITISENFTGSPSTFTFYYKNDKQPHYCCVIGNYYIFFDSYDQTQDTTLQSSKTLVYGWVVPAFQMVDNYVPVLDDQQFPMLLNEAKSLAFLELKQTQHPKAEQEVLRQLVSLQKFKAIGNRPAPFHYLPDFGRRGVGYGRGAHFTTAR